MPCRSYKTKNGMVHICFGRGQKPPPGCRECGAMSEFLCDFPVGDGKTCDRDLCAEHAHEIGPEQHYCTEHLATSNAVPLRKP